MSSGTNEVETSMDTEVNLFPSRRLLFLPHIRFVLVVNEVDNGSPRVLVVHIVAESWGVDDGELGLELLLLKLGLDDFDFGQLVELLVVTAVVVLGRCDLG